VDVFKKSTPHASAVGQQTTAPVQPGIEWARPADIRRTHGISRSLLYTLIAEEKIRSVSLRRKGRATGCRLVSVASLNEYIASFAD
jgi:hypothetical protein